MDVQRGGPCAIFERLLVALEAAAGIRAGDTDRRVGIPLATAT